MRIFSTAPSSMRTEPRAYLSQIGSLAAEHESYGVLGMLVYTDNRLIDAWTVAQAIIDRTKTIMPLIAVQPFYMHPFATAQRIVSLSLLYGRNIALNMVAGGSAHELKQLGDSLTHDERYKRLVEYTDIMISLISGMSVTKIGSFYSVKDLRLLHSLDKRMIPELFFAGASDACVDAARQFDATRLNYSKPPEEIDISIGSDRLGLRLGIIARPDRSTAWNVAQGRFPPDRRGQIIHEVSKNVSESVWYRKISDLSTDYVHPEKSVYWLGPLRNNQSMCPYLVGSYQDVGRIIEDYRYKGFGTLILDVCYDTDDLIHVLRAMEI